MNKKVYKKNKKGGEKIIYLRKNNNKKITISALLSIFPIILLITNFYYLNFSHILTRSFFVNLSSNKQLQTSIPTVKIISPLANKKTTKPQKEKNNTIINSGLVNAQNNLPLYDQIIWHGPRNTKEIALTFDADMTPIMVDWLHSGQVQTYDDTRITDYLIQNQIKATFFLTGLWIESYPDATKALADNSLFELENHSYSHPSMAGNCFGQPQVPQSQYPFEIEKTQQLIEQYTHETPKYFRFPGGCYDQSDLDLVKKEGLVTVHWDDVANDGFNTNEDEVINNVLSEAQNGSIIVMHMGGQPNTPETANALPTIIAALKNKGYTFVTVAELLNPPKIAAINPKEYLASLRSFQSTP